MATGDILLVLSGAGVRHPANTSRAYYTDASVVPSDAITPAQRGMPFSYVSGALPPGVELVAVTCRAVGASNQFNSIDLRVASQTLSTTLYIYGRNAVGANLSSANIGFGGATSDYFVYVPCHFLADLVSSPGVFASYEGYVLVKVDPTTVSASSGITTARYAVYPYKTAYAESHLTRVMARKVEAVNNGMPSILDSIFPAGGCSLVTAWGTGNMTVGAYRNSSDSTKSADIYFGHGGTSYYVTVTEATPSPGYLYVGPANRDIAGALFYIDTALMFKHHINASSLYSGMAGPYLVTPDNSYALTLTQSDYATSGNRYFNLFLYNVTASDQLVYVSQLQEIAAASFNVSSVVLYVEDSSVFGVATVTVPANGYAKLRYEISTTSSTPAVGTTGLSTLSVI